MTGWSAGSASSAFPSPSGTGWTKTGARLPAAAGAGGFPSTPTTDRRVLRKQRGKRRLRWTLPHGPRRLDAPDACDREIGPGDVGRGSFPWTFRPQGHDIIAPGSSRRSSAPTWSMGACPGPPPYPAGYSTRTAKRCPSPWAMSSTTGPAPKTSLTPCAMGRSWPRTDTAFVEGQMEVGRKLV